MREIHKIIVPIDFLKHTDQIVEYAGYIAKKFDAGLHFIHVVEHAEKLMQQFITKNRTTFAGCKGKVIRGNTVDSIIQYTDDEKADLIVIGTHGRKGLSKMWLGSVAERIIKRAQCPTLTCNPYKPTS